MTDPVESELKIPVDDLAAVAARLVAVGGTRVRSTTRERNVLFDRPGAPLAADRCALRLRRAGGQSWLTFKGRPSWDGGVKSRSELEIEVSDPDVAATILGRLGYEPVIRYDKDRERWRLNEITVELDRTLMGDFVELEGPAGRLADAARSLGLDPESAAQGSYLALWRQYRARHADLDLPEEMVLP